MNLFDFSLQLNGYPLDQAKKELAHIQQKKDLDFKMFLEDKRHAIVNFHVSHNNFYKSLAPHANSKHWDSIPVMTKKDLQ